MQGLDPPQSAEQPEATGSWRAPLPAAAEPRADRVEESAPTVLSRAAASSPASFPAAHGGPLPLPGPGQRLDAFELREPIGSGGMGAVFRALDLKLDRPVALKILPPAQATDAEVLQRFYHEGRSAARLDHENIARVYTLGCDQGIHYIAFEFIEGTTIRQRVEQNGPLSVAETINYTLQIAGALVHANERGVVHRDIKPSNIIVTPQGRAKLVDMGLARRFEHGDHHGLTQSGMTLGTFDYISPEQARDPRDVDVRSDLYSLGCTIFHMLTGRPPFPEGTVLQKLLQHQEEPPPDVRTLNPNVPPDLAAILIKLMAKNRDRRYQTPEQLVRDLLTVAGSLGLRSMSPEGLVWMSASPPPYWERHLVWGLPALALTVIVGTLLWFSQEPEPAAPVDPVDPAAPLTASRPEPSPNPAQSARPAPATGSKTRPAGVPEPSSQPHAPRQMMVGTAEELAAALESAPSRSTIVLTENGPYVFRPSASRSAPLRLNRPDLTIKAGEGVRPVLRLARGQGGSAQAAGGALLQVTGGRLVLEGLDFLVELGERDDHVVALLSEGTDLSLHQCLFRAPVSRPPGARVAALRVRANARGRSAGDRPPPVEWVACHCEGGQIGVQTEGPVSLIVRDCTFAGTDPAFWCVAGAERATTPIELALRHLSILAPEGPVFRFANVDARVRIDDSVVAPRRAGEATLVATDDSSRLDWLGRSNLYANITTYLQPSTRGMLVQPPIRRFDAWADGPLAHRESESVATSASVWEEPEFDPLAPFDEPARALRLSLGAVPRLGADVGARRGPFGPIARDVIGATTASESSRPAATVAMEKRAGRESPGTTETAPDSPPAGESPKRPERSEATPPAAGRAAAAIEPPPKPMPMPMDNPTPAPMDQPPDMPIVEPMGIPGEEESPATPPSTTPQPAAPVAGSRPEPSPQLGAPGPTANERDAEQSEPIRTPRQFRAALERLGARGGTLRLAAGADLDLSNCEFQGTRRWSIEAEPGARRPILRFQPDRTGSETSWPALFRLQAGSLKLQGVDLVLSQDRAPAKGPWAVFTTHPGTDLTLVDCTVTIEGETPRSAVVAVLGGEAGAEAGGAADPPAARVTVTESLVRSGGDLADVAPGRRLELEITNAVIATAGTVVHGHGAPARQTPEPLKLVLRQVTMRAVGGLALLESTADEPKLPLAEVVAFDSILATDSLGAPLFRVDGQDAVEALRDRIRWEGHAVVYHQIRTYRRDQTAQTGILPVPYDRSSWTTAVAPRDDAAMHTDAHFAHAWDDHRPLWTFTRDDARLDPESPARIAGADLPRIPDPPPRAGR
jgi:serine/threonine protein kinase